MQLTPDDILFLQTICRYFHENGGWPTLRWLEGEVFDYQHFDVLELEYQLQRKMTGIRYFRQPWEPERQVKLTIPVMLFCYAHNIYPEIKDDLDAFISVVRLCVSKYYEGVELLTVTDSKIHATSDMSETMSRKMFLLVTLDSNIMEQFVHAPPDNQGHIAFWYIKLSQNIRVYRNVQTLEDYLTESTKHKQRPKMVSFNPTNPGRSFPASSVIDYPRINAVQSQPISARAYTTSKNEKLPENSLLAVKRTKIFISYSRKNKSHLERLQIHLEPYRRAGIDLWDDTRIAVGQQWRHEIERALAATKVAILLVSADFLASKFITENELPPLLAAAKTDGAVIIPVVVGACNFTGSILSQFQAANNPSMPLDDMPRPKREKVWSHVANVASQALAGPL